MAFGDLRRMGVKNTSIWNRDHGADKARETEILTEKMVTMEHIGKSPSTSHAMRKSAWNGKQSRETEKQLLAILCRSWQTNLGGQEERGYS